MMTKSLWILVVVSIVAGGVLWVTSQPRGLSVGSLLPGGEDRAYVADRTVDFLEDIKFKDFDEAATYHLPETQEERDIPNLIRRVFRVKHEVLDIQDYEILGVEMDRGKKRARVRAFIRYRVLGDPTIRDDPEARRDLEMLFYWFQQEDGSWVMELESSLR